MYYFRRLFKREFFCRFSLSPGVILSASSMSISSVSSSANTTHTAVLPTTGNVVQPALGMKFPIHKVIIIGSGPAAHTAAIYTARAEMYPLLFEGFMATGVAAGGQLTTTTEVENFPGFPDGINGPLLMEKMRAQSEGLGTKIITETITKLSLSERPFRVESESGDVFYAHTLIIATGATAKRMDIPGTRDGEYWQKGVSACAVCDGALPIFRGKPVAVVGGGDSAMEEALFLTKFASKVYLIHRRDELRASKIMQSRAKANEKIEFCRGK